MLVEFSVVPLGAGASVGPVIAEILKIVDASGIPYKLNPMGTVLEGEWEDVMELVRRCHASAASSSERVMTRILIDDRKGYRNRIEEKVKSVEARVGKRLRS